ncbi:MAG: hypothetical protein NT070_08505 [Cyanobacteria bacterium]|nr:hypothetical protein [Cyanobacteriota bacterium]
MSFNCIILQKRSGLAFGWLEERRSIHKDDRSGGLGWGDSYSGA